MDYKVDKVSYMENAQGTNHWLFVWLSGDQDLVLLIKEAGKKTDKRVYLAAEDFQPGTRKGLIANDGEWLFQPPADLTVEPDWPNLKFTTEIIRNTGDGERLSYLIKSQGEQSGPYREIPEGVGKLVATLVEYWTDGKTDNPELLILELGAASQTASTNIQMYLGASIRDSEIRRLA
jgi:hypothetical protein